MLDTLLSVIAPFDCLVCGNENNIICSSCFDKAIISKAETCYRCNRLSPAGRTCGSCRASTKLAGVIVTSHYDGVIKELIGRLKYHYAQGAAGVCAKLLAPRVDPTAYDLIVPVPSSPRRFRQRGYNQAALIAKALCRQASLPYADALWRTRDAHQVGLNRSERLEQVKELFEVRARLLVHEARILLIDDVVTTGATMSECAAVLKAAGAKSVWGAAVAKH
jgi:competence protein ComFC